MTEFNQEARHYCRNKHCRSKLPGPVSNPREAFCTKGCHGSFYLKRCMVCEGPIERKREDQKVCRKAKCRSAWRARSGFGRYHTDRPMQSWLQKPVVLLTRNSHPNPADPGASSPARNCPRRPSAVPPSEPRRLSKRHAG